MSARLWRGVGAGRAHLVIEMSSAARSSGRDGLWQALETDGRTELLKVLAHDETIGRVDKTAS